MSRNDVSVRGCEHCRFAIVAPSDQIAEALERHIHPEAEGLLPPDFVVFISPAEAIRQGYDKGVLLFQHGQLVTQTS